MMHKICSCHQSFCVSSDMLNDSDLKVLEEAISAQAHTRRKNIRFETEEHPMFSQYIE
ncbi:hypothetical protein Hanom_Chr07g00617191 [Helianthus anomalus]